MEEKLKRGLGLLDVFCIASGAMISSGLFVLPAIAHLYDEYKAEWEETLEVEMITVLPLTATNRPVRFPMKIE